MYGYQPRDTSGPSDRMDIDNNDLVDRLGKWSQPETPEGPQRKRAHHELEQRSISLTPGRTFRVGQNTPWLFNIAHAPPPPEPPVKMWSETAAQDNRFNIGSDNARYGTEDVEMEYSDSPARPPRPEPPTEPAAAKDVKPSKQQLEAADAAYAQPAMEEAEEQVEVRPIALGGVKRELQARRRKAEKLKARVDDESEEENAPRSVRSEHQHHYNFHSHAPSLRHSEIPSLMIGYIQVFINVSVVLFVLYLAVSVVLTVRQDIKDRMKEASIEILQDIAECSKLYMTNRCDPHLRVPAMEAPCKAWEACMSRDPTMVGRTNVLAETFAGVINSFVEPISWKTMGFTLTTLCFLVILTNSALWNLKSKVEPVQPAPSPSMYPQLLGHQSYFGAPNQIQGQYGFQPSLPHLQEPEVPRIGYGEETAKGKWWKPW